MRTKRTRARRGRSLWAWAGRYASDESGIALIVTLFVVALVTILVLEFYHDAAVELSLAVNYGGEMQAYHLALSGVSFARAVLQQDDAKADGPGDFWYDQLGPETPDVCYPPQLLLSLTGDASSASPGGESLDTETPTSDATEGNEQNCVSLRIFDEQSKLPINAIMAPGNAANPDDNWHGIFEEFFTSFEIDLDLLDALVDWIDKDDSPRPGRGAENAYYEGLETPYEASNRPMQTVAELRLVRGFAYETLAKLFPDREPEAMVDADLGSNAYFTVYGQGEKAKVNLNTANAEVLQALLAGLGADSTADVVEQIIATRQETLFENLNNIDAIPSGIKSKVTKVADVKSAYFRVESVGVVGPIQKRAVAVLYRQPDTISLVYFKVE